MAISVLAKIHVLHVVENYDACKYKILLCINLCLENQSLNWPVSKLLQSKNLIVLVPQKCIQSGHGESGLRRVLNRHGWGFMRNLKF